jgi:CubicO group peptidase (beta-lactamase class C family)
MKTLSILFLAICLGVLAFSVHRFARGPEPVVVELVPGPPQPKVSPGEAGIDAAALAAAVDYAGARRTRALLVGRGGHLVFEKYWDEDTTLDTEVELSGFTPALAALAVGSAVNDRRIVGLDLPVSFYLPGAGEAAGAVTVRQLLSRQGPAPDAGADAEQLARILEKVDRAGYDAVLAERLWKPMGAGRFSLARRLAGDGVRSVRADCCLRARLGDWMRVGELLSNDGVFEGNQFAPPRFVSEMLAPTHRGSPVGWFTRVDGTFASRDVARLESAGKQRLWVVPSLRLVILRVGGDPGDDWDEAMIPDSIIRGTRGWQPAGAVDRNDPKTYAPH